MYIYIYIRIFLPYTYPPISQSINDPSTNAFTYAIYKRFSLCTYIYILVCIHLYPYLYIYNDIYIYINNYIHICIVLSKSTCMYLPDPRECIYVPLYVENVLHESHAECSPCCVRWHASKCSSRFESPLMGYYPVSQLHQLTQKVYVQGKAKLQPAIQLRYYFQLLVTTWLYMPLPQSTTKSHCVMLVKQCHKPPIFWWCIPPPLW